MHNMYYEQLMIASQDDEELSRLLWDECAQTVTGLRTKAQSIQSASDADTLANMVTCAQHLRKPADVTQRYVNQLRNVAPSHPWIAKYGDLEASFDRCAAQMAA